MMRRWFRAGLLLHATGLSVLGYRLYDAATDDSERALDQYGCPTGDPLQGVYAELRLTVLRRCVTATGVVRDVHRAEDGDAVWNLELDAGQEWLVNEVNDAKFGGRLHVEVVPMDQNRVPIPRDGERATVTGVWVLDHSHGGHLEIHPAVAITIGD